MMQSDFDSTKNYWYVLKAPYREQRMQQLLEERGYATFLPMETRLRRRGVEKKAVAVEVPVINNLFLHVTWSEMQRIKSEYNEALYYVMRRAGGRMLPLTVPEKQMQTFIDFVASAREEVKYHQPGELNLKRGMRVRIHGGVLDGKEVTCLRVRGSKTRRIIVVELPGLLGASTEVSPDMLELI